MKIFLDSADPVEIESAYKTGMIDGITTNPTLATKAGIPFEEAVHKILDIVNGPINLEVISTDAEGMLKEANKLAALHENVVVKIPMIPDGIQVVKELSAKGIRTNVTLIFSAAQALLAAKAGANYVSPFIGRLNDISYVGMDLVAEIKQIYQNYDYETEILVASERTARDAVDAALVGADIITMKFENFMRLFKNPLTDIGLEKFLNDWEESGQEPVV